MLSLERSHTKLPYLPLIEVVSRNGLAEDSLELVQLLPGQHQVLGQPEVHLGRPGLDLAEDDGVEVGAEPTVQRLLGGDMTRLCFHWSSPYITVLSLVESLHKDATPALLCHAIKDQLNAPKAPNGVISCLSVVLYGIRISGFNARKESIKKGGLMP